MRIFDVFKCRKRKQKYNFAKYEENCDTSKQGKKKTETQVNKRRIKKVMSISKEKKKNQISKMKAQLKREV